eukprot:3244320-Rhodomonas_salina.1
MEKKTGEEADEEGRGRGRKAWAGKAANTRGERGESRMKEEREQGWKRGGQQSMQRELEEEVGEWVRKYEHRKKLTVIKQSECTSTGLGKNLGWSRNEAIELHLEIGWIRILLFTLVCFKSFSQFQSSGDGHELNPSRL